MAGFDTHPLFHSHPELQRAWVSLIPQPTPVARLERLGRELGHANLFVKREDLTAPGYGGNKVRNLEFLLGLARAKGFEKVAMVAPLGSNFVAAAASQSARIGMRAEFFHFVPTQNDQLRRHFEYTRATGAALHVRRGRVVPAILKSSIDLGARLMANETLRLPMGGSDEIGSLGHVNAALELALQIRDGELPEIDFLVVGAGTCGTVAGLLVGLRMAGLKTKVIGVRCVDRIVCNETRIASLANRLAKKLELGFRFRSSDVDLVHASSSHYARPLENSKELIAQVESLEQIVLDTTYTTKVIDFLKAWLKSDPFGTRKKNILYWHTFSPVAMGAICAGSETSACCEV